MYEKKHPHYATGSFSYTSYTSLKHEYSALPEPFQSLDAVSSADSGSCLENSSDHDYLLQLV